MKVPRPKLDGDDLGALARIGVYSVLVLWVAFVAGLAIRILMIAGFA